MIGERASEGEQTRKTTIMIPSPVGFKRKGVAALLASWVRLAHSPLHLTTLPSPRLGRNASRGDMSNNSMGGFVATRVLEARACVGSCAAEWARAAMGAEKAAQGPRRCLGRRDPGWECAGVRGSFRPT